MLITFEGIDGCGKSTQIELLRRKLEDEGYETVLMREPGGTTIGESIRNILLDKVNTLMTTETELLLFEAARAQIVREFIRPMVSSGKIVLCDRFIDSSVAYQGYGRNLGREVVDKLNKFAIGETVPDITFIFDIEPSAAIARMESRGRERDRLDEEGIQFMSKVREGYLEIAKTDKERVRLLNAEKDIDELSREIYKIFKEVN